MAYTELKLNYLLETKCLIREAAVAKGAEISESDTFRSYAEKIAAINGDYSDIHFVTFMSEDGTQELYKRAVVDGDDCADPVIRGLISEPTKESTAQYNYTHVGWSASPSGALDENILKAVKADKTVYANFAAVLRYYTITYYDEDGTTVLKTESVAYGSVPSFEPTAPDGYMFSAWLPELSEVTGDASYTVVWEALPAFATSTWAEIAAVCEAGNAAITYAVGDTKDITLTDGTVLTLEIAGFNHDNLADGSGKASISVISKNVIGVGRTAFSSDYPASNSWENSAIRQWLVNDFYATIPEDLKTVIKEVAKQSYTTHNGSRKDIVEKLWIPSIDELRTVPGNYNGNSMYDYKNGNIGSRYALYPYTTANEEVASLIRRDAETGVATAYYTRSRNKRVSAVMWRITALSTFDWRATTDVCGWTFGFCI